MPSSQNIKFRIPVLEDGMSVFRLIQRCPPLDTNSSYCNLLQCGHFSSTSVAADLDGELVGFISGYLVPERPGILFIWQVAVDERARGLGLVSQMLAHMLNRSSCRGIRHLETTITKDNKPSWGLFKSLAKRLGADIQSSSWLDKQAHFDGQHDSESLVRIGPFNLGQTRDLL
ncbi:diaminobutyrate acetyltransferase [Teredinibacter haidensis]|uniref:diaminobutyrate acetyltransferase n=1 Tax=Teredinibacter haidensis TaxID=2731755 RepID=UPI001C8E8858|nr:diaminobutyrate acetyltransferase [Teredinibacter haidensis]